MLIQVSLAGASVSVNSKDEMPQGWVSLPQDPGFSPLPRAGWAQGGSCAKVLASDQQPDQPRLAQNPFVGATSSLASKVGSVVKSGLK